MALSIIFLAEALYRDAPGGSRRVIKELSQGLAARGHRVTVLAPRFHGDEPDADEQDGVHIRRYGNRRGWAGGLPRLVTEGYQTLVALRREAGEPFDVLHAHFAYSHLPALLLHPTRLARATIRSFYGPWASEGLAEAVTERASAIAPALRRWAVFHSRDLIERRSLARADHIIALSDYSIGQLTRSYGVPHAAITLVPGGVDHCYFTPPTTSKADIRRRLGLPVDGPIILTVRRLAARMGLDNLIAAMPCVLAEAPTARLVIVGQGALRPRLEAQASALGLSQSILFTGFVADVDLPLYYQAADLFVLPTRTLEGFGLITLEAFASGLPVAGTPIGATPELLAQVDKRLILDGTSADAIAKGIVRYVSEVEGKIDVDVLRALVLTTYTWETVVSQTETVYDNVLHKARWGDAHGR